MLRIETVSFASYAHTLLRQHFVAVTACSRFNADVVADYNSKFSFQSKSSKNRLKSGLESTTDSSTKSLVFAYVKLIAGLAPGTDE